MSKSKILKIGGMAISIAGAVLGVAATALSDKRQELEMQDMINVAVDEKISNMSNKKETEEELV